VTIAFVLVVFRPADVSQLPVSSLDSSLAGEWTGLFREYRQAVKAEEISSEGVLISVRAGNAVTARVESTMGQRRSRSAEGRFGGDTLVLYYVLSDSPRAGGTAVVIRGNPKEGLLKGYWLGYDPEQRKLMTCPYVLARSGDTEKIKSEQQQWLAQPCYSPSVPE
jgi:hypothetical protein